MSYPVPPAPMAPPPKKKVKPLWIVLAALGGVVVLCLFGSVLVAAVGGDDGPKAAAPSDATTQAAADAPDTTEPETTEPDSPSPSPAPKKTKPAGPAGTFGDGQWLVGRDIKAGTYRTAGPEDNGVGLCYWERAKNASGELDAIIANGDPTGPANLTVNDGEYVKSTGCQTWHLAG
ncbi:hypothetical protein AB0I55_20885 [Actinocatenispora sera]|uniref:hypothetical protein n=1 Tax=Actinocatenispora sera TaxID=390989 RepID=UPI0033F49E67